MITNSLTRQKWNDKWDFASGLDDSTTFTIGERRDYTDD